MVVGFAITGPDNDSYMFRSFRGLERCDRCGQIVKGNKPTNRELEIKVLDFDFSYTYDGCIIVSKRFMDFCVAEEYQNLCFTRLNRHPTFFHFEVSSIIRFDAETRKTRFENECAACGQYESIVGAHPVFLMDLTTPLSDGFFRTDLCFGSGDEKTPVILVGIETHDRLISEDFNGLEFMPVNMRNGATH
jgi:ribosomal protein S14